MPREKFVEVMVQDTMTVEPDYIEYLVTVKPPVDQSEDYSVDDDYPNSSFRQNTKQLEELHRQQEALTEQLLLLFRKNKISYRETALPKDFSPGPGYVLTFTDLAKVTSINQQLTQINGADSYVYAKRSSRLEEYERQLTERLLKKAKAKASLIAQAGESRIKGILQVKEVTQRHKLNPMAGGWVMEEAPLRVNFSRKIMGKIDEALLISLNQIFLVRYEIV